MPSSSKSKAAVVASGTTAAVAPTHETRGAIVRVSMRNFVTYKDVEVRPGDLGDGFCVMQKISAMALS